MQKIHLIPKPILVDTKEKALAVLKKMKARPWVAIDTETTGLDTMRSQLIGWSVGWPEFRAFIVGVHLTQSVFKEWLEDPKAKKVLHHAKFDVHIYENHGIHVQGVLYDTFIIDWLVDENRQGRHGLKECAQDHLDLHMDPLDELFKKHKTENFGDLPADLQLEYGSKDAWATAMLVAAPSVLWKEDGNLNLLQVLEKHPAAVPGQKDRTLLDHLTEIEVPFISVLQRMERRGVSVDKGFLLDLQPRLKDEMDGIQFEVNREAGEPIKLTSAPALRRLLYGKLGLKPTKWTKGGQSGNRQPAVDHSVIEEYARKEREEGKTGIFCHIEKWRKMHKIQSTYVEGLLEAVNETDNRVHSSFHVELVTGRLSSSNPNLQNIPNSKKDLFGIRAAFTAQPSDELPVVRNGRVTSAGLNERTLIVADYSTLEMCIAAHFSEDRDMIKAIIDGVDIHARTAASMYGYDYDEIVAAKKKEKKDLTQRDKDLLRARDDAKVIGFGLIYGMQAYALSINLECTPDEAQEKMNRYFATYPGVLMWIGATKNFCRDKGFVQTVLGRYRRLRDITKGMTKKEGKWVSEGDFAAAKLRRHAENMAINTPIQGTAADIAKVAMLRTSEVPDCGDSELQKMGCNLLLQVHDELIWECPVPYVQRAIAIIRPILEHPFPFDLKVPLRAEIGTGFAWNEAK
jgi:DNA polymerase-1